MDRFVMREVPTGYKFDLKAANGQTIATSEVYKTAAACRKGIRSVMKNAPMAALEDQTEPGKVPSNPKFQLYLDRAGAYRFRLRAQNGGIIAVSEAYSSKHGRIKQKTLPGVAGQRFGRGHTPPKFPPAA